MGRKIRRYLMLNNKVKLLYIEALLYLGYARILVFLPFSKVAPFLGRQMTETPYIQSNIDLLQVKRISNAVNSVSRHTFWESKCLVRAIAGMKMLERRKIDSTLYLGTGKDSNGKMIAHAWLRTGDIYITGADVMNQFTVVGKFAKINET